MRQAQLPVLRLFLCGSGRAEKFLIDRSELSSLVLIGDIRTWVVLCLYF